MVNVYDKPEFWCGDIGYRPPGYSDFPINLIKEMCIILRRPISVLDVGCAFGFTVDRLRRVGIETIGVDISHYALDKAPESVKPFLLYGAAQALPFPDKVFDLAFSSGVLEHLPQRLLKQAIAEIVRVSHRGLIGVSCSDDPTTRLDKMKADKTHEVVLSRKDWRELFPEEYEIISDSQRSWLQHAYQSVVRFARMK